MRRLRRHGGWAGLAGALLLSLLVVTAPGAEPDYRGLVLGDAPAAYWRLGEAVGPTAADASANAVHGAYKSGVVLGVAGALPDDPNRAARFDGSDDRVVVADPASGVLDFGEGDFSVEAWIATRAAGELSIAGKRGTGPWWHFGVTDDAGQAGRLRAAIKLGSKTYTAYGTTRVDDGGWHHVVAVFDRDSAISLYVDGALAGSRVGATSGTVSNTAAFQIGKVSGALGFAGEIDEVALYPAVLPLERIRARHAAGADTVAPSVTLEAPADGSSTTDSTPTFSGRAGTASGDAATVTVRVGGPAERTLTATRAGDGAYAVDASPALDPGTYTARAEQRDGAGNTGTSAASTFTVEAGPSPPPPPPQGDPVIIGAADIAACDEYAGDDATALLLDAHPTATVFTAGDNVYGVGSALEFSNCYDPTWGRAKARTRPAAGNHDYGSNGAPGYFGYFGAAAGDPARGYYSYDLGTWHIVVLNTNCSAVDGCEAGSDQEAWLRADLAAHPTQCTLAYWHHPRWNSGSVHRMVFHDYSKAFWEALYEHGAEVVVNGHEHLYERFLPQTVAGAHDPAHGIVQFTAGMGGYFHYDFGTIQPNSAARNDQDYGVLKFVLHDGWYEHEFLGVAGVTYTDAGSASCHGKPGDVPPPPDTEAPTVTLTQPADGSSGTDPLPSFAGVAGTALRDSATVTVKVHAGRDTTGAVVQTLTATRGSGGAWSIGATSPLAPGDYTARAEQADAAGNTGTSAPSTFTIAEAPPPPPDTTAPAVTLTSPADGSSTSDATPRLAGVAGTAPGDAATVTLTVFEGAGTGGAVLQTLTAGRGGDGGYTTDAAALGPGTYTARAHQSDAAGNTGTSAANAFTVAAAPPYTAAVAEDAPRGHWRLGEAGGTTAADQTAANPGSYLNGTVLGAAGAIAGDADTAARFDGVNDQVSMGDPASGGLDFGTEDHSVEAWVRTTVNGERAIVSKRATSAPPYWQLTVTDDSGHVGEVRANFGGSAGDRQVYGPARRVDDGAWHHVVAVFDRDTGITVHVDGIARFTAGAIPGDVGNTGPFLIGKSTGYGYFGGDLDEVAVYPSALPAARVQAHLDAGRAVAGAAAAGAGLSSGTSAFSSS